MKQRSRFFNIFAFISFSLFFFFPTLQPEKIISIFTVCPVEREIKKRKRKKKSGERNAGGYPVKPRRTHPGRNEMHRLTGGGKRWIPFEIRRLTRVVGGLEGRRFT